MTANSLSPHWGHLNLVTALIVKPLSIYFASAFFALPIDMAIRMWPVVSYFHHSLITLFTHSGCNVFRYSSYHFKSSFFWHLRHSQTMPPQSVQHLHFIESPHTLSHERQEPPQHKGGRHKVHFLQCDIPSSSHLLHKYGIRLTPYHSPSLSAIRTW